MSNSTGVLLKAGTACPSRAHEFTPGFLWGPCCLYFYFLCCHIVCFLRSRFHIVLSATISTWKRCSVRIFLQLFVWDSCLVCVICFVFAWVWWCPARIVLCFCFVFRRLLCPMLPVSLDCSFVIATWRLFQQLTEMIITFVLDNTLQLNLGWLLIFNATFNNISFISWRLVLSEGSEKYSMRPVKLVSIILHNTFPSANIFFFFCNFNI